MSATGASWACALAQTAKTSSDYIFERWKWIFQIEKKQNTNWIVMVLTDPFDQIDGNSPSRETFAAIGHKSPPPTATAKWAPLFLIFFKKNQKK